MLNVLQGFFVLSVIVAAGYILQRYKFHGYDLSGLLSRLCFFLLTPLLMLTTMQKADFSELFHLSSLVAIITPFLIYMTYRVVGYIRGAEPGQTIIKGLSACYVNAGNVGIPIVVLALGDATAVAPVIMFQLLFLAPLSFFTLDSLGDGTRPSFVHRAFNALTNPLVLGVFIGLILGWFKITPTPWIWQPVTLLSNCAIPTLMMAFGASMVGAQLPKKGDGLGSVITASTIKLVGMPFLAWFIGSVVFGLSGRALLAPIMTSALPTAQNVFMYSVRYEVATAHARDTVLVTTLLCIPVVVAIVGIFGA